MPLVVGADGLIGRALWERLAGRGEAPLGTTRRVGGEEGAGLRLDLSGDVTGWRPPPRVSVAFLCAAVTNLRACEEDPVGSARVNVAGTLDVARALADSGAFVVFLSTNLVFDGSAPFAGADEPVRPATEYGRQKAAVERAVLALGDSAAVVRFTKVLGPRDGLVRGWVSDLRRGAAIHPFRDKVMAPVPVGFAAEALVRVGAARLAGVTQVSADRDISYEDAARFVCRGLGLSEGLVRPTDAPPGGARALNPRHTTLDASRTADRLGLRAPAPWAALNEVLRP